MTRPHEAILAGEIRELIALVEPLPDVQVGPVDPATMLAALRVLAFGYVVLGREIAEGVLAEAEAKPARGLNAVRLARHLWETEQELHYAHEDPSERMTQFMGRDAKTRLWLARNYKGFSGATPEGEFANDVRLIADEVEQRDAAARERRDSGEEVDPNEYGTVPDRRTIARALARIVQ